jgi:hypothetical protein
MDADLYQHLSSTVTPHEEEKPEGPEEGTSDGDKETRGRKTTSVSLPQELDEVVHAITASPWAARLGSLVGTVRKQVTFSKTHLLTQSGTVFETTRERASKELDLMRSGIASLTSPPIDQDESSERETSSPPRITAASMFSYLKSTADAAQKKLSPALMELSKAEDAADAYLIKLGTNFGHMIKDAVTIAPPEESLDRTSRPI